MATMATLRPSRYFPGGVKPNACGHAAMYNQIALYQFLGLPPPPPPPAPAPPPLAVYFF